MVTFMIGICFTNITTTQNPTTLMLDQIYFGLKMMADCINLFDVNTSCKAYIFTLKGSSHSVFTTPNKKPSS